MKKFRKQKREKPTWVFAKSLAVALVLSCAFAVGFQTFIHETINYELNSQIEEQTGDLNEHINLRAEQLKERYGYVDPDILYSELDSYLTMYTTYDVQLDQFGLFDPQNRPSVQIAPNYSKNCHAMSALTDKDGNIIASSRMNMQTMLMFQKDMDTDMDRGFYQCDLELIDSTEIESFIKSYYTNDMYIYAHMEADSLYVNKEDRTFIPHEGRIKRTTYKKHGFFHNENGNYLVDDNIEKEETKEFTIDINDLDVDSSDYELIEVHMGLGGDEYPKAILLGIFGTDTEVFDCFSDEFTAPDTDFSSYSYKWNSDSTATFARSRVLSVYGEPYTLNVRFVFNYMEPQLVRYYWTYTILVAVLLIIIALLYAWRRNVKNKAKYAMEDFRRDLTNALAHDIKTPLTAIGGYAENILDGGLSEDEQQRYLHSIIDNVAFTDSMVNCTLRLNTMDGSELGREKVSVGELVESAVKKYDIVLEEKNITFKASGSAEIKTNGGSLGTIVENLVSNAVKYTTENGTINAELDKKRLVITNTVAAKVDVNKLKQPFVRGDASRSNTQGSGLGLSLADRAAVMNGMVLKLACTDTEFRAELKF